MSYDVFLSHNRRDKPWVRSLYKFLSSRGLKVFFDEESIPPGQSIVGAIDKALKNSKRIVLVLSPASVQSPWVALERQAAVMLDPTGAKKQLLIPIIVAKLPWKHVPASVQILKCIDLTDPASREANLAQVMTALGVKTNPSKLKGLCEQIETKAPVIPLEVAGIEKVLDWRWTGVKLLQTLIKLDYATLEHLTKGDEGNPKQWAPVFMNHPQTWRMLIDHNDQIDGYWHFAPLFTDDYKLAKAGKLLDSQITASRVRLFELPGLYDVYFVQLCLHPRFRQPRHVMHLFRSILGVLEELSADGIFIRNVCANAYTEAGDAICHSFNLKKGPKHQHRGRIYSAPIAKVFDGLGLSCHSLRKAYKKAGLL